MLKKKTNKSDNKIIENISKILGIKKNELLKKDDFSKIDGYDSLKHLEIMMQIDKLFKKKTKLMGELSRLTSIKKILKKLNK